MVLLRKVVVGAVGGVVLLVGLLMVVLPGPAFLVIPAGLSLLALEFEWARRALAWFRERFRSALEAVRRKKAGDAGSRVPASPAPREISNT